MRIVLTSQPRPRPQTMVSLRDVTPRGSAQIAAEPRAAAAPVTPAPRILARPGPRSRTRLHGLGEEIVQSSAPTATEIARRLLEQARAQELQAQVPAGVSWEAVRELGVQAHTGSIFD